MDGRRIVDIPYLGSEFQRYSNLAQRIQSLDFVARAPENIHNSRPLETLFAVPETIGGDRREAGNYVSSRCRRRYLITVLTDIT
jgi:hypothetical protein